MSKLTALGLTLACLTLPVAATVTGPDVDSQEQLAPLAEHPHNTRNIVDALAQRHYVRNVLDDQLSPRIFQEYLDDLDPSRSYLLASDIAEFKRYEYQMDNALSRGNVAPAFEIFNRYHERVIGRFERVLTLIDERFDEFDFTVEESLEIDREEAPWALTNEELDELWRKRIKNEVLNLKMADKEPEAIKDLLIKRYTNRLARTRQTNSEDVYQLYMNSFTKTYDPHTQYFSPRTAENFNINMSLSLEGIGAVLQREDEYTKVVSLVPAGPADKSRQLFPNDKIVRVGQGEGGEMVDVVGWRLDEVVQLIRGKKDTIVRLDVIPAKNESEPKIIAITRNTVKLEEQSAKSEVIEVEQFGHTYKIGVIDIPTFYVDFRGSQRDQGDYKSTTADVKKLLEDLKDQQVDGIIVDLRDNGGGSLQEANLVTGLFIDRGPTVQIRQKSNRVDVLTDKDISTVYEGPLAVLVNRLSASASEIFAGAIQDYQRGIVIGSQTFGKGTVQSLMTLSRGQLKLTQAKFYRISGESTQHQGIIPDIAYPSDYDPETIGESTLEDPLPWDKIQPTGYRTKRNLVHLLPELRNQHAQRVANDPDFEYLTEAFTYRKARSKDTSVTLSLATRQREKEESDAFWLSLENKRRVAKGLEAVASLDDLDNDEPDLASAATSVPGTAAGAPGIDSASAGIPPTTGEAASEHSSSAGSVAIVPDNRDPTAAPDPVLNPEAEGADSEEDSEPDPYLVETGNILVDLISLTRRTAERARLPKS